MTSTTLTHSVAYAQPPALELIVEARFSLGGEIGRRLHAVTEQWLLPAPYANPKILEMFRLRDRLPYQEQVPWAGEFAGKYLTHAVEIYRLTRDTRLRDQIEWFVTELIVLQAADGYLGPWPEPWRLRAGAPTCAEPWDAWGHYHIMLGLLLWYRESGNGNTLEAAKKIGDLFCDRFLEGEECLHGTGMQEMNQAPIHSLLLLYQVTGDSRHRRMAERILEEFAVPPAGDYLRAALASVDFHESPKPRWESLHPIMGLSELAMLDGRDDCRQAFEHWWWSMLKGDRHNNGGFTSGEQATGNPNDTGAIETCCTIAWMAMGVEMLRLTGNSIAADEIELSLLNSGLGMMSPSGRWVTYDTPMDGERRASAHEIVFQARAGSAELNCCSVNGPRALGLISAWGIMRRPDGFAVNYYGPGTMSVPLESGVLVRVIQTTDYPREGIINIRIDLDRPEKFLLALRIPYWSHNTSVLLNEQPIAGVERGQYLEIRREWQAGDNVRLELDFTPHAWLRQLNGEDLASLYRGPILLTFDPRLNTRELDDPPVLNGDNITLLPVTTDGWLKPWLAMKIQDVHGAQAVLCDFAGAGLGGNGYRSWLPIRFREGSPGRALFDRKNPLRSIRFVPH